MANNTELISQCEAKAKQWLSPAFDEETRKGSATGVFPEGKLSLQS